MTDCYFQPCSIDRICAHAELHKQKRARKLRSATLKDNVSVKVEMIRKGKGASKLLQDLLSG